MDTVTIAPPVTPADTDTDCPECKGTGTVGPDLGHQVPCDTTGSDDDGVEWYCDYGTVTYWDDPDPEDAGGIAVVTGSAVIDATRFRATLAAVAGFAGKNDARPILTGVRVEYHPGHLTMVATDSYRLAVFPVPADVTGTPGPVLLAPGTVAAILALVKPGIVGRAPNPVTLELSGVAGFRFDNGAGGETTGHGIDGEYPNYRGLIPEFQESGGAVAFNPGYLEATGKAFRVLLAGSDSPVRVSTDPHTVDHPALAGGFSGRPVLFTVADTALWPDPCPNPAAILMPVRIR